MNVDTITEKDAVQTIAKIMTASIRTAPKGRGWDRITFKVLTDKEIEKVAQTMENISVLDALSNKVKIYTQKSYTAYDRFDILDFDD